MSELQTSLQFKNEDQKTAFGVSVAQSGFAQKAILQAMIDEFLENPKNTARIVARAADIPVGKPGKQV